MFILGLWLGRDEGVGAGNSSCLNWKRQSLESIVDFDHLSEGAAERFT